MPITPDDLLNQAASVSATDELSNRLVVNRAYYACFHAADGFHRAMPTPGVLPTAACGVHETLYHQLLNPTLPHGDALSAVSKRIALIGRELKKKRKDADYELNLNVSRDDAVYAVSQAKKLLEITGH